MTTVGKEAVRLVLLPAVDGTGLMFAGFITQLAQSVSTQVLSYPTHGPQDYTTLAQHVLEQVEGEGPYVLLGECFAGPLVYRVAALDPERCRGMIFAATFLSTPAPRLMAAVSRLPARWIAFLARRVLMQRLAMLSGAANERVGRAIAANFNATPPAILKARLQVVVSERRAPTGPSALPSLYIQAQSDRFVRASKLPEFDDLCSHLTVERVAGGHFILQENPGATAAKVKDFLLRDVFVQHRLANAN